MPKLKQKAEKATFAAGCFWGIEYVFSRIHGVLKTKVGYTGGKAEYKNPTYEEVCSDATGHVEAVEIIFDPKILIYKALLDVFWKVHDPTTINRQGPDIGSQYRSAVFCHSEAQKGIAEASLKEQEKKRGKKIVTEISKAGVFYDAEEYHQNYVKKHGINSCHVPKLH